MGVASRADEAETPQHVNAEPGARLDAVAPAWARITVLAALMALAAYSALFAPKFDRNALGPGVPEWVMALAPAAAPTLFGALVVVLLWTLANRAEINHRALMDKERRFRKAVEAARCGIWEWDLEDDRVYVSDVMGAMLGAEGGTFDGEAVLELISPEHRERVLKALKGAAIHGAFDVCFRAPGGQGRPLWVDARGQALGPRGEQGFSRIVGVALDVTDERLAQARAQAAEMRLRSAIESASEAFALWDRGGRLLLSNENFRAWFGLEPRVLLPGAKYGEVMDAAARSITRQVAGLRGSREAEIADGRWIQISERRTADGGLVLTAADVTAIKRQEEARARNEAELQQLVERLRQHQAELAVLAREYEAEKTRAEGANRAKSEFLANMSHELRTPLNAINGFSEIMKGEMYGPLGDKRYKEYANDIFNSGQHLLALINDVLDMAKIEAGKLTLHYERVTIDDVVEDAMRLMRGRAEATGLEMQVALDPLPEIEADYRALKQILLNLLSNALKFTPRGGRITLQGAVVGDLVRLSVRDTGIGISAEDLSRLARPFEQVETQQAKTQQGTGLGLALTRSLIEMHGGVFELSSEPGQGTTASFALPIVKTVKHAQAAA
jgi:two-component system cell cycle sensor histidine kinase PleC